MKLAIHDLPGSFSDGWIAYCEAHGIPFRRVDCQASDIVAQVAGCDALLWHWRHSDAAAQRFARQLALALAAGGKRLFPDPATCWHYDDKIGQKYLLEAVGAPLVPTWVFHDRRRALAWLAEARFPLVFKLRRGAGGLNVRMVPSAAAGRRLVRRAFGRGFPVRNGWRMMRDDWQAFRRERSRKRLSRVFKHALLGLRQTVIPFGGDRESGYAYFQEFIPGNDHDLRVVVIGRRAFAMLRRNRPGDFRASGSGLKEGDPAAIPRDAVVLAFQLSTRLGAQCLAFDFLRDPAGRLLVSEISYAFTSVRGFFPGYWDDRLEWHPDAVDLTHCMIEDLLGISTAGR